MYNVLYHQYTNKNNNINVVYKKHISSRSPIELEFLLQRLYFNNKSKLLLFHNDKIYETVFNEDINDSSINDSLINDSLKNILNNLNFNDSTKYSFLEFNCDYINNKNYTGCLYVKSMENDYDHIIIEPIYFNSYNDKLYLEHIVYFPFPISSKDIDELTQKMGFERVTDDYFKLNNKCVVFENFDNYYKSIQGDKGITTKTSFYEKPNGDFLYEGHNIINPAEKLYDFYCIYKTN